MPALSCRPGLLALLSTASASPALAGNATEILIAKLAFSPAEVTVHVGDTVEWTNNDFVAHTATTMESADGPGWDVMIPANETAALQLVQVGTIEYYCRFHPGMKARIIVLGH